jgi:hypothetical protein
MRVRNMRGIIVGIVMIIAAIGFFVFMMGMVPRSSDPAAMMQTVGEVSGVVGFLGFFLIALGFYGKKIA